MAIKHLIFDFFGTLGDTDPQLLEVKRGELLRYGHDKWMVQDKPPLVWFQDYAKDKHVDPTKLWEQFLRMEDSFVFFEGLVDLLERLKDDGYGLHILSNTGNTIEDILKRHPQVEALFDSINCSYEMGVAKPDERAFRKVLKRIEAKPQDCVMIGDSRHCDIEPAWKLGMHAIHFQGRRQTVAVLKEEIKGILKTTSL